MPDEPDGTYIRMVSLLGACMVADNAQAALGISEAFEEYLIGLSINEPLPAGLITKGKA